MSSREIDEYLDGLDEPKRSTLEALRRDILAIAPDVEECRAYGVPGFRAHGTVIAGFAAAKNHLSYFPHSGAVLERLGEQLSGYDCAKGTLRFPVDQPLPRSLVETLIATRLAMIEAG